MNAVPPTALHDVPADVHATGPSHTEEFIRGGERELFIRNRAAPQVTAMPFTSRDARRSCLSCASHQSSARPW